MCVKEKGVGGGGGGVTKRFSPRTSRGGKYNILGVGASLAPLREIPVSESSKGMKMEQVALLGL